MCEMFRAKHSRREFVSSSAGAAAAMLGLHVASGESLLREPHASAQQRRHLDTAKNAARWIEASRMETPNGVTWPADPADPDSIGPTLYSHSPGVVLFFLDLYHSTGESAYLESACAGAEYLVAEYPAGGDGGAGFYTGAAGILFCLAETFRASGRSEYDTACRRLLGQLHDSAQVGGSGVTWNSVTDIISGAAGIGLTLLYANRALPGTNSTDLAVRAGRHLLDQARPEAGGLKWPMAPDYGRLMPNFSHGTAGVAYYLACLYEASGDTQFLDAAIAGARYLQAVARRENDTFSVFHNEPDGLDLYYLSWCHGPPGTARLFYKLAEITGDDSWMEWVHRAARGIMQSGIPEQQTPGFWNNVSQCCGHVGVGEFLVSLYKVTRDEAYRAFAERVTADLLRRASDDALGISWTQAEHRTRPELLVAQTGYMQGAAGTGSYFLHLDALERNGRPAIAFPDSPFRT